MKLIGIALVAVSMLGFAPASAADLPGSFKDTPAGDTVVQAPYHPFAGAYVGVFGAWERIDVDHGGSLEATGECNTGSEKGDCFGNAMAKRILGNGVAGSLPGMDDDGFALGVNGGYNFTAGRIYFGPRVSFSYGETEASYSVGDNMLGGSLTVSKEWLAELDGKLGVAVTDRVGLYIVGGVAFAKLEANARAHMGGETLVNESASETLTGWSAGAGADIKLAGDLNLFVEYKHFDFGSLDASGRVLEDCVAYTYGADTKFDTIKVGLNLNF